MYKYKSGKAEYVFGSVSPIKGMRVVVKSTQEGVFQEASHRHKLIFHTRTTVLDP